MTTTAPTPLPSLDDIVFEGRNKAYGAYVLRQQYGSHVRKAMALATALAALLIAVPLVVQYLWPAALPKTPEEIIQTGTVEPIRIDFPENQPSQPSRSVNPIIHPHKDVAPKVVEDEKAKPVEKAAEVTATTEATNGPETTGGESTGPASSGPIGNSDTVEMPVAPPAPAKPFIHVEEMPEFMGGTAALTKYLQRHLHYPATALREGVSGKVYISFTVNTDGTIADVEVLKGLGYGTDEEASRVIRGMPAWKPGRQNQHAVPVRYTLPITFQYE